MRDLKSRNLLLLIPHFRTFIRDQVDFIRPHFGNVSLVMPTPFFSKQALQLPFFGKHFRFLESMVVSNREPPHGYKMFSPKFFTLPVEPFRKRNYYLVAKSCLKALSRSCIDFDLVHAHFLENGFAGASLKGLYCKPFVVTAHGSDVYDLPFRDSWQNNLARFVLSKADHVITVSQFNAKKLLLLGVSPKKLKVIPNGYDERLFKKIPSCWAREKLGLPAESSKRVLLSVGNLNEGKGHTYLIDAMEIVLRRRSDVILVIIGTGHLLEVLRKKASHLGLKRAIFFMGSKRHDEIPIWMGASDLFVLPSLSESQGTVIPEAMACGKPVIGTKVGGIPEGIPNDEVGLLVDPRDSEGLAHTILEALDKKWISQEISNHAKMYSWSSLVEQILRVYEQVLM